MTTRRLSVRQGDNGRVTAQDGVGGDDSGRKQTKISHTSNRDERRKGAIIKRTEWSGERVCEIEEVICRLT